MNIRFLCLSKENEQGRKNKGIIYICFEEPAGAEATASILGEGISKIYPFSRKL